MFESGKRVVEWPCVQRGIIQAFAIGRSATSAKFKLTVKPTKLVYRVKGQDETKVENPQSKTLRI